MPDAFSDVFGYWMLVVPAWERNVLYLLLKWLPRDVWLFMYCTIYLPSVRLSFRKRYKTFLSSPVCSCRGLYLRYY